MSMTVKVGFAFAVVLGLLFRCEARLAVAAVPAGTAIVNRATVTYTDAANTAFEATSNSVSATVASISGLLITPNETACNPATDSIVSARPFLRTFTLVNGGNVVNAFVIVSAKSTQGHVTGTSFYRNGQPISGTTSPPIAPGASIQVIVTADASGIANGTQVFVALTVRTSGATQNGVTSLTAAQCAITGVGPKLAGLAGPSSVPQLLVNGLPATQAVLGSVVTYTLSIKNYGDAPALATEIDDTFPTGTTPQPTTVTVADRTRAQASVMQNGQAIRISLGAVAVGAIATISIRATLSGDANGSVVKNVATITATNIVPLQTSEAAVLIGTANVVFDGESGKGGPLAGATVALIEDGATLTSTSAAVALDGIPVAPNLKNADPYVTGGGGGYALALSPKVAGAHVYDLIVTAVGYGSRRIRLNLTPDPTGSFYQAVVTALDSQPLAGAGTFALANVPVTLGATYGVFGNIPMFRVQSVVITKLVDRAAASGGDRLVYTINVANNGTALGAATVSDVLPTGVRYGPGTALVDGVHVEPKRSGYTLSWPIPALTAAHVITFAVSIVPYVPEQSTIKNVASVTARVLGSAFTVSAQASASTVVIAGLFTDRTIVTGRVYVDKNDRGWFERGDAGVPYVRIFFEDGESVTTDDTGRYNFPSVRPGMHVLRLDETSLPATVTTYGDRRIDHEHSTRRLMHDPVGGGVMEDINFGLRAAEK